MEQTGICLLVIVQALLYYRSCCGQVCSMDTTIQPANSTAVNYIRSPNYPEPYPSSQTCQYETSSTSPYTVMYSVEYESLETGSDVVSIYSVGKKKLRIYLSDSPTRRPAGVTASTTMELFFTSDASVQFGGFSVAYIAVNRANLPACGSIISATTTEIQLSYLSRQGDCTWTINAQTPGNVIEYKVLLVRGQAVWIDGGTTNAITVYGSRTYESSGASIQLQGSSGNDYVVTVKEVVPSPTTVAPTTTTTAAPMSTINICEGVTPLTATSTPQILTSPNYPGPYSSYLSCSVHITAGSGSGSVFLEVIDLDLENDDVLSIRDGPTTAFRLVTTPVTGGDVTSTGANFLLSFTTDSYSNLRGFKLRYTNTSRSMPTCATSYPQYDVNTTSQTVTSPNFPNAYSGNQDEYFLFMKSSETESIVLTFTHFDLEDSSGCVHDYVKIYDGPCADYSLLAHVCGHEIVTISDTSGLYMLLHFHTDNTVGYTGFSANYYIGNVDQTEPTADDTGVAAWRWVLIGIFLVLVLLAIIAVIAAVVIHRKKKMDDKEKLKTNHVDQEEPLPLGKMSTLMLIADFRRRMEIVREKGVKAKRKGRQLDAHPPPNVAGPNVKVLRMTPAITTSLPPVGSRINKTDTICDDDGQYVPFEPKSKKTRSKVVAAANVPTTFDYRSPGSQSSCSSSISSSDN